MTVGEGAVSCQRWLPGDGELVLPPASRIDLNLKETRNDFGVMVHAEVWIGQISRSFMGWMAVVFGISLKDSSVTLMIDTCLVLRIRKPR